MRVDLERLGLRVQCFPIYCGLSSRTTSSSGMKNPLKGACRVLVGLKDSGLKLLACTSRCGSPYPSTGVGGLLVEGGHSGPTTQSREPKRREQQHRGKDHNSKRQGSHSKPRATDPQPSLILGPRLEDSGPSARLQHLNLQP